MPPWPSIRRGILGHTAMRLIYSGRSTYRILFSTGTRSVIQRCRSRTPMNHLDGVVTLADAFQELFVKLEHFQVQNPVIVGVPKLQSRVKKELLFAKSLEAQLRKSLEGNSAGELERLSSKGIENRLQGLKNNLRGLVAELEVAKTAPGVVAVSQVFPLRTPGNSKGEVVESCPKKVEVDVVAQQGHLWIEVKDAESFGIGSTRWMGCPGHVSGIQQQALLRLRAAQMPHNWRRWEPISVLFHFPSGVDPEVAEELLEMGALVSGPGALDHSLLPRPPLPPLRTNLDVTALCALCSEVCNGGATDPRVQAWAAGTSHWEECVEAEKASPALPRILPFLEHGRRVLAARTVVDQFQVLMDHFAGPKERERWRELLPRLEIIAVGDPCNQSGRVEMLPEAQSMSKAQRITLSLGDALKAVTVTANARSIQAAAAQGIFLEAFIHRAVWLTGL